MAFFNIRSELAPSCSLLTRKHIDVETKDMLEEGGVYILCLQETESYQVCRGPLNNEPSKDLNLTSVSATLSDISDERLSLLQALFQ